MLRASATDKPVRQSGYAIGRGAIKYPPDRDEQPQMNASRTSDSPAQVAAQRPRACAYRRPRRPSRHKRPGNLGQQTQALGSQDNQASLNYFRDRGGNDGSCGQYTAHAITQILGANAPPTGEGHPPGRGQYIRERAACHKDSDPAFISPRPTRDATRSSPPACASFRSLRRPVSPPYLKILLIHAQHAPES